MRRTFFLVLSLAVLSACSAADFLGGDSEPLDAYELRPPQSVPQAARQRQAIDVVIETPAASGAVDTDRILVRTAPAQIQYLPDARWVESVPQMVQTALVEALEASGGYRYVGRRPLGPSGDFAVIANITDFHAAPNADGTAALIRLALTARIIRESDASVVATRGFTAAIPVEGVATAALVAGFNAAAGEVFTDMAGWVLRATGPGVTG